MKYEILAMVLFSILMGMVVTTAITRINHKNDYCTLKVISC